MGTWIDTIHIKSGTWLCMPLTPELLRAMWIPRACFLARLANCLEGSDSSQHSLPVFACVHTYKNTYTYIHVPYMSLPHTGMYTCLWNKQKLYKHFRIGNTLLSILFCGFQIEFLSVTSNDSDSGKLKLLCFYPHLCLKPKHCKIIHDYKTVPGPFPLETDSPFADLHS